MIPCIYPYYGLFYATEEEVEQINQIVKKQKIVAKQLNWVKSHIKDFSFSEFEISYNYWLEEGFKLSCQLNHVIRSSQKKTEQQETDQ